MAGSDWLGDNDKFFMKHLLLYDKFLKRKFSSSNYMPKIFLLITGV